MITRKLGHNYLTHSINFNVHALLSDNYIHLSIYLSLQHTMLCNTDGVCSDRHAPLSATDHLEETTGDIGT